MTRLFADQEDERYGEFRSVEVKRADGTIRQMEVTDKWLVTQNLKKEMAAAPEDLIQANFIGPRGDRIAILRIGEDVGQDVVSDLRDPGTGQLYGMYSSRAGKEEVNLTTKAFHDEMKEQIAKTQPFVDEEVRRAVYGDDDGGM